MISTAGNTRRAKANGSTGPSGSRGHNGSTAPHGLNGRNQHSLRERPSVVYLVDDDVESFPIAAPETVEEPGRAKDYLPRGLFLQRQFSWRQGDIALGRGPANRGSKRHRFRIPRIEGSRANDTIRRVEDLMAVEPCNGGDEEILVVDQGPLEQRIREDQHVGDDTVLGVADKGDETAVRAPGRSGQRVF